jgi:hypothetical protein
MKLLISFSFNQTFHMCINTCSIVFNKSVFNWTFCQLLMEKPNYTKVLQIDSISVDDEVSYVN